MEKRKKARISDDEKTARKMRLREELINYQYPKEGGRRTLENFADEYGVTRSLVSQWIGEDIARYPNDDQVEGLCRFFGLPAGSFSADYYLNNPSRKYELPSQAIELTENTIEPYFNMIGLEESFLQAVRCLTDFNQLFPVWSPMVEDPSLIYRRLEPFEYKSEVAQAEQGLYQMVLSDDSSKEQKRVFLHPADAVFLKEVQDSVKSLIVSMFQRKREEMEKEVLEARRAAIELQSDNEICRTSLTTAEMQRIDKGLTAPTLQQLKELPAKDKWLEYLANASIESFDSSAEFEAARKRSLDKLNSK